MPRINSAARRLIRSRRVQGAAMATGVAEEFASAYVAGSDVSGAPAPIAMPPSRICSANAYACAR